MSKREKSKDKEIKSLQAEGGQIKLMQHLHPVLVITYILIKTAGCVHPT